MAGEADYRVERLSPERKADFFRLHGPEHGADWCRCVAWWVAGWEGWGERTAEQNLALREGLFERGEMDGYLLFAGDEPAGWCQAALRERLPGLVHDFGGDPEPDVWAVACFFLAPAQRGRGLARRLLEGVLADLRGRGARRVEAYPRRARKGEALDDMAVWNGRESLFRSLGFEVVGRNERRLVMALEL